MAWERGYYYRVRKVNGRVVREYVGRGRIAQLVAQDDDIERKQREVERNSRRAERVELDALDASLNELNEIADLLVRAALLAAGYRQHNRSEWRRKRGPHKRAEFDCSDRPEGTSQTA
jgi:hypothetical protein